MNVPEAFGDVAALASGSFRSEFPREGEPSRASRVYKEFSKPQTPYILEG